MLKKVPNRRRKTQYNDEPNFWHYLSPMYPGKYGNVQFFPFLHCLPKFQNESIVAVKSELQNLDIRRQRRYGKSHQQPMSFAALLKKAKLMMTSNTSHHITSDQTHSRKQYGPYRHGLEIS